MANITRRTNRRLADHLRAGESVQAALLCEAKGTYGPAAIATAALPRFMTDKLENRATAAHAASGGIAAAFPGRSCVVAVTELRVLVAPSNGLTFGAPVLEVGLGDIALDRVGGKGIGKSLRFVFRDGSAVTVDAQRAQPFDRVARLLDPASPFAAGA